MIQIPATLVSDVYVPSLSPPKIYLEMWFDGTNFNYHTYEDSYNVVGVSPRSTIVQIWEGSRTITNDFFGLHVHDITKFPNGVAADYGVFRIHDAGWDLGVGPSFGRTRWNLINPSNGVYIPDALDSLIDYLYTRGKKIIYTLCSTPVWASARPAEGGAYGAGTAAEPSDMAYVTSFITWLINRYLGKITVLELWNEADHTGFFTGTKAALVQIAKAGYQAAKTLDSNIIAIAPNVTGGGHAYLDQYFTTTDGAGGTGKDWLDAVSIHPYPNSSPRLGLDTRLQIQNVQAVMAAQNINKPLWCTEAGFLPNDRDTLPYDRMKFIEEAILVAAALGTDHWSLYSYDSILQGISDTPQFSVIWNRLKTVLTSGIYTRLNRMPDGRMAATIGEIGYITGNPSIYAS